MSTVTEKKPFFHSGRRELFAKTLMVLVQISMGTALASGFFLANVPFRIKTAGIIAIAVMGLFGILTCPDRPQKGE